MYNISIDQNQIHISSGFLQNGSFGDENQKFDFERNKSTCFISLPVYYCFIPYPQPLTVCFIAGPALRMLADRHVVLHIRHHWDADFRQHRAEPQHGNQQAQQFSNVCPGSNAIVSVIIIKIFYLNDITMYNNRL